jgi:Rrf2 family protein
MSFVCGPQGSVTISEISKAERISTPLVAKLLRLLRKAELVVSVRGQTGGYSLARPAQEIPVGEVLAKLGGKFFDAEFCGRYTGVEDLCIHTTQCSIRVFLKGLQGVMDDYLKRVTLADLLFGESRVRNLLDKPGSRPSSLDS